jgi:hypothetical protein
MLFSFGEVVWRLSCRAGGMVVVVVYSSAGGPRLVDRPEGWAVCHSFAASMSGMELCDRFGPAGRGQSSGATAPMVGVRQQTACTQPEMGVRHKTARTQPKDGGHAVGRGCRQRTWPSRSA